MVNITLLLLLLRADANAYSQEKLIQPESCNLVITAHIIKYIPFGQLNAADEIWDVPKKALQLLRMI
jgi:hypothetical protein